MKTDETNLLELYWGEVWEYVIQTYDIDESDTISSYLSFDNRRYYLFWQKYDRNTLLLVTKTRNGFQSHEIKWEMNEMELSVHKLSKAFPESLILIQDHNIKSIEVIDQWHAWRLNVDNKQAVFFSGGIEKVRAFDRNDQLTYEYDEHTL